MATILTLIGGVFGSIAAAVAVFVLQFSHLMALGLWGSVGLAFCVLAIAFTQLHGLRLERSFLPQKRRTAAKGN